MLLQDKVEKIHGALGLLKEAREILHEAGAKKAADAVRRALKSTDGALRNAQRFADKEAA